LAHCGPRTAGRKEEGQAKQQDGVGRRSKIIVVEIVAADILVVEILVVERADG
jgi:hypothetical protein